MPTDLKTNVGSGRYVAIKSRTDSARATAMVLAETYTYDWLLLIFNLFLAFRMHRADVPN